MQSAIVRSRVREVYKLKTWLGLERKNTTWHLGIRFSRHELIISKQYNTPASMCGIAVCYYLALEF